MLTNDIKKGRRGMLKNGWPFTIADNAKGVIRMATVEGFHTETGSIYMFDVDFVFNDDEQPERVEFTAGQQKTIRNIKEGLSAIL